MRLSSRLSTFLIVLTLFSSCSLARYPTDRPSVPIADLLGLVRKSNDEIRSIRGVGRVEVVANGKRYRARQFMLLAKPDKMRIDLLHFLDLPYLRLAFEGESFQAMDMRENVFYTGELAKGISLFVPLKVTSREFIGFIFGEIPEQEYVSARYNARSGLYELNFPPSTKWESQIFRIHPKMLKVVEVSKTSSYEKKMIRVSYSRFKKRGAITFPTEVEIEVLGANNLIRFTFRELDINPPLPRELFRLMIPPDAEVVRIDEKMRRPPFVLPELE